MTTKTNINQHHEIIQHAAILASAKDDSTPNSRKPGTQLSFNFTETEAQVLADNRKVTSVPLEAVALKLTTTTQPYTVGGSFTSGCTFAQYEQALSSIHPLHPARLFLPTPTVSRKNTKEQIERAISGAYPYRTCTVRPVEKTDKKYVFHVHIGSDRRETEVGDESLSDFTCRATVKWKDTPLIESVDISRYTEQNEFVDELPSIIKSAEQVLNSTAWNKPYTHMLKLFKCRPLYHGSWLLESELASEVIDTWSEVARACGQRVGRADRPQQFVEMNLAEEVQRMIAQAEAKVNSTTVGDKTHTKALESIAELASTITKLKNSIGLATSSLDASVEHLKSIWDSVKAKPKYYITEKGQTFCGDAEEKMLALDLDHLGEFKDAFLSAEYDPTKVGQEQAGYIMKLTPITPSIISRLEEDTASALRTACQNGLLKIINGLELRNELQNYANGKEEAHGILLTYNFIQLV